MNSKKREIFYFFTEKFQINMDNFEIYVIIYFIDDYKGIVSCCFCVCSKITYALLSKGISDHYIFIGGTVQWERNMYTFSQKVMQT